MADSAAPRRNDSMKNFAKALFWMAVLPLALFYAVTEYLTPSGENKAAAEAIAVAAQEYRKSTGRYPKRLEDLVPKYLPAMPQAGKYFYIVYAAQPDGSQCWVAYQVHRDRFEELDCRKGTWGDYEIEDAQVSKHPDAQYLVPEMRRQ